MAKEFHWPHGKRICVSVSVMLETWSEGKAPPYGVQATSPKPGVVDLAGIAWGSYGGRTMAQRRAMNAITSQRRRPLICPGRSISRRYSRSEQDAR